MLGGALPTLAQRQEEGTWRVKCAAQTAAASSARRACAGSATGRCWESPTFLGVKCEEGTPGASLGVGGGPTSSEWAERAGGRGSLRSLWARVVNFIPLPGRTQVLLGSAHSGADGHCGLFRVNGRCDLTLVLCPG